MTQGGPDAEAPRPVYIFWTHFTLVTALCACPFLLGFLAMFLNLPVHPELVEKLGAWGAFAEYCLPVPPFYGTFQWAGWGIFLVPTLPLFYKPWTRKVVPVLYLYLTLGMVVTGWGMLGDGGEVQARWIICHVVADLALIGLILGRVMDTVMPLKRRTQTTEQTTSNVE